MIYKDYPKDFPLPLFSGYAIQTDMGLIRTGMETGAFKQRRRYNNMPQTFTLSFAVPMNIYYHWQTWVNEHAYQYIKMNLTSYKTQKGCSSEHIVRFISNLSASPMSAEVFTVSVTVEEKFGIAPKTASDWVIARDERAGKGSPLKASPDTDISLLTKARDPDIDVIISGTPSNPSARI